MDELLELEPKKDIDYYKRRAEILAHEYNRMVQARKLDLMTEKKAFLHGFHAAKSGNKNEVIAWEKYKGFK